MTNDDAFVLDGMRLIKLSETSARINYETEQGLIKVAAFLSGTVIRYFEVSYPNGNTAVFGYTSNGSNQLSYPMTTLTDLRGNSVTYSYSKINNHYYIGSITYAGASVSFLYETSRPDPVVSYEGGLKLTENRRLQKIECKSGGAVFRTYEFTYQTPNPQLTSLLKEISCTSSGKSLNPLRFYYGTGNTATSFTKAETQLYEWYANAQPGQLILNKGKFDYGTDNDGLISLPNKNPYWQHYRSSGLFRHSQNRYDNLYDGTEKIFLYAGLDGSFVYPMPNLTTETGFTDVFTADIDGKYEEEVIKVNNTVSGNNDRLQFKVYSVNLYTGLALKYTRVFNFSTVLTDKDGGKSIHPKFHFVGDFTGDGKMKVLSVSNNHPFGWTDKPGRCYLFDLETGSKLYEGTPFTFYKEFVGTQQGDPEAAAQNSDRLFAFDYDGDGKTDICLINDSGTHIYTFDVSGSGYTVRHVSSYSGLKKSTLEGRQLLMGEFNGDGKPDFLLTTQSSMSDWAIYYSKGNGQFDKVITSVTSKSSSDRIFVQDVNGDGLTDIIKTLGTSGFFTYLTRPGASYASDSYTSFDYTGSELVPTNINSRNYFHQLVALKDGKVTRFSYPRNDTKEKQLTGSVNSLGVVSKNHYLMLNESEYYYTKGSGAVYPFENFHGPFSVPVGKEYYVDGILSEDTEYRYNNAVIHKQGRGFCGFGEFETIDNIRGHFFTQEFDPYNFGVLEMDESPTAKITNTWSVSVQPDKIAKILLTNGSSLDKLSGQTVISAYIHDSYGNMTKETVNYGGGITAVTDQTYYNSTSGNIYMIGQPITRTITNTRGGSSWKDKETYTYNEVRLPVSQIIYTGTSGTNKTGETRWTYDTNWNISSKKSAPYNVTTFIGQAYTYDASGKYIATVTNDLSQTTTYSNYNPYGNPKTVKDYKNRTTTNHYDEWGRVTSVVHPEGVTETTAFAWDDTGLFTVARTTTGHPDEIIHYDALGREIRVGHQRFDGQWQYSDHVYDYRGRLEKTSLLFRGSSPSLWNSYTYDSYDRPTKLTEASGKNTTWSYSGLSVTETRDGIASTKTTDASGALVSVNDPGGTVTYTLRPDGQPSSVTAPGGVATSFGYDAFGRQTSINDPSAGTQSFTEAFTSQGVRTTTVKDANNKTVTTISDQYDRVTNVNRPEFNTTYAYNADGLLASETSTNGTSALFTYDSHDRPATVRENAPDGKWLKKTFSYNPGNVSSVQYESQDGSIGTENFVYAYGHNTEIKLNGTTTIWKLTEENALGQPTKATTGSINRTYSYTAYGMPTGRTAGSLQDFTYSFDVQKGNLLSRKDNKKNKTETFGYDNLNRLSTIGSQQISYAANGNITAMPGVGTLAYENSAKPYQVTMLTPTGAAVPIREQSVTYTSYQRPNTISEDGITASFAYNSAGDRVKMDVKQGATDLLTRYYLGKQYELDVQTNTQKLYLGGDAYSAPAIYVKEGTGSWKTYYILRDYLGSITHIAHADGTLKQELSYDAWGRLRDPSTQVAYVPDGEPALFLGRGYTGHEYLPWFGLVNMNARLYDPALGRFLSPDPYVQMPDFTQNFNRYSYALNNPLVYVDPDGEIVWFVPIIIGAVIGGTSGYMVGHANGATGWGMAGYIAGGALIGGLSGGAAAGVSAAGGGAMLAGAAAGAIGGAGFNGLATGWNGQAMLKGAAFGAISGFVGGGIGAAIGGGWGALAGGAASNLTSQLLYNGGDFSSVNWESIGIRGAASFGLSHGMQYLQYRAMNGRLGQMNVTYKQFSKINTAYQRSRFWHKEYGVVLNTNGSARFVPGADRHKFDVTLRLNPRNGDFATAHTHWAKDGVDWVDIGGTGTDYQRYDAATAYPEGSQIITAVGGYHSLQDLTIPGYSLVVGRTTGSYSIGGAGYHSINPDPYLRFFLFPWVW